MVLGYHGVSQVLLLPFPPETGSSRPSLVLLLELEAHTIKHMSMLDHRGMLAIIVLPNPVLFSDVLPPMNACRPLHWTIPTSLSPEGIEADQHPNPLPRRSTENYYWQIRKSNCPLTLPEGGCPAKIIPMGPKFGIRPAHSSRRNCSIPADHYARAA